MSKVLVQAANEYAEAKRRDVIRNMQLLNIDALVHLIGEAFLSGVECASAVAQEPAGSPTLAPGVYIILDAKRLRELPPEVRSLLGKPISEILRMGF